MKIFRRFAELVTNIRNNLFLRTRLRLTFFYIIIIAVILIVFSQILYLAFTQNVHRSAERYEISEFQEQMFVQDADNQLFTVLLVVNAGILVVTGSLSYYLAGKTLSPIQEALEQQKQFLSDASHELRTPIAILKTNMEVELESHEKTHEYRENLKSNLSEVNRMAKLVSDLLLLSRLDSSHARSGFESFKIGLVLSEIGERMRQYAKTKSVRMTTKFSHLANAEVIGNRDMLSSAILNVVKNAVDYNTKDGKVEILATLEGSLCRIIIEDTGIGISKNEIPHIFQRFYRVDPSRSSLVSGTGLGLAIAQAIITEHKGEINIESREKKGTVATITIPVVSS